MPDDESTIQQTATEETATAADLPAHEHPAHETAIPAQAPDTLVAYDPLAEDAQAGTSPSRNCPAGRAGGCSGRAGIRLPWRCSACC